MPKTVLQSVEHKKADSVEGRVRKRERRREGKMKRRRKMKRRKKMDVEKKEEKKKKGRESVFEREIRKMERNADVKVMMEDAEAFCDEDGRWSGSE